MKPCPYCAELIQDQAAKCRYCGEWLDPSKRPAWSGAPAPDPRDAPRANDPAVLADEPPESPTAATLPVGSGLPELQRAPEPERTWSAPAWLANAQATQREPEPEPTPATSPAPTDHATLEEVALRMERIRQSAAAVRQSADAEPAAPARQARRAQPRAELEVEPGVTLPAGSLRAVDIEDHPSSRRGRSVAAAPEPAPVIHDDDDLDDYEERPRRRRRRDEDDLDETPRRRAAMPDAPRARSHAETEPARDARGRKRGRRAPEPEPEPPLRDELEDEEELDERPRRRKRRREPEPEPPPPPASFEDDFDDEDDFDEPPPRRAKAKGGVAGFEDDFDDEDDFDGDDDFDDFGDMGPAPQPLPWKPIALGAVVVALALGFFFRDSLFPGGDGDEADAAETDGAADGETDGEAAPDEEKAEEPEPETKAEGEGKPVEPEAAEGGEAAADGGAAAPPKPPGLDPELLTKLDEARQGYKDAKGNGKKLEAVGTTLQEILGKAPEHPEALTLMAQVYLEQEKYDDSLAMATRCTAVAADRSACWLTIGVIQEVKGEKEPAAAAYQKYIDLDPEGQYAKQAQAALKRLK